MSKARGLGSSRLADVLIQQAVEIKSGSGNKIVKLSDSFTFYCIRELDTINSK